MNESDPSGTPQVPPAPDPPRARPPGLLEQLLGVFTDPVPLFRRLAAAPSWGPALAAIMGTALAMVAAWSSRVDPDALLRPVLARDPRMGPEAVEVLVQVQGRLLGGFAALGVLAGVPALVLAQAWLLWLVARGAGPAPAFARALSAVAVSGLAAIPKHLLVGVLCLALPVGGRDPDQLAPLSPGAWLGPGHGRWQALLDGFDLFAAAGLALLYLAARHTLGLRPPRALLGTALAAALGAGLLALGGR